jgi:hypothetical protein
VKNIEARHHLDPAPVGGATVVLAFHFDGHDARELAQAAALAEHALHYAPHGSRLAGRIKALSASLVALEHDESERDARMRKEWDEEDAAPPLSPAKEGGAP